MFNVLNDGAFLGIADLSDLGISLNFCPQAFGEEQFMEVQNDTADGVEYATAFVKPELGYSWSMDALPPGVERIRVVGNCPSGPVELTVFDGTTISPSIGTTFLVGDPIVLPQGCDGALAHRLVFDMKPLTGTSIDPPHMP